MTTTLGTTRTVAPAALAAVLLAAGATTLAGPAGAAPATGRPRLVSYAGGESPGVTVHRSSQTARLRGAPASFKHFVGRAADELQTRLDCDPAAIGITVDAVRTDGYAVGAVSDCGGYQAIWAEVDGRWREVLGTQDSFDCRVLVRYAVPSDIAGDTCYNYGRQRERPYHQA